MERLKIEAIDIHVHPRQKLEVREAGILINLAKKLNIRKVNLLGDVLYYGYHPSKEQIRKVNNLTIKLVKRFPDFFTGFCFINPEHERQFIEEEIKRCVLNSGLKGVKLEVSCNASDKRTFIVAEIAQQLNIPILHHACDTTNINSRYGPNLCQSDPEDIAILAKNFPKLKIIMAHITGCGIKGILEIKNYTNIYTDTSGFQPVSGILEYATQKLGAERILFGSDVPGRDFAVQISKIYAAKIKDKDKEKILYLNAKRLLAL